MKINKDGWIIDDPREEAKYTSLWGHNVRILDWPRNPSPRYWPTKQEIKEFHCNRLSPLISLNLSKRDKNLIGYKRINKQVQLFGTRKIYK